MALITRISRLFKADFHAVLDQIEEPEQLLKQAIREMEDDLTATEKRIQLCAHEQAALVTRRDELESSLGDVDEELDLCFESKKNDLARGLVRKKLEAQRFIKQLNTRSAANEEFLTKQKASLDDNRATLEGLKQKAEILAQRSPNDEIDTGFDDAAWLARNSQVNNDEVEVAFLREKNRRSAS